MRELVALNVAETGVPGAKTASGTTLPVGAVLVAPSLDYNPATDYATPPQPTGLRASGGFSSVFLEWDGAPYKNPGYTEIWRSQFDVLGGAVMVGTTVANVYADPVTVSNTTYYYWIRFVSSAGIVGPYNSTSGTPATVALDVAALLPGLQAEITSSQLFSDLGSRIQQIEVGANLTSAQLAVLQDANSQLNVLVSANGSAVLNTQKVTKTQATQISALGTRVGDAESTIVNLQSTTGTQATQISSLTTRVGSAESNITSLQSTTASQATSITNLTSSVNSNTTSIQTLTTTTNGLSGQYTVKIDNNGHVSGFGLASTTTTSGPTSAFIVRADRFAIAGANDTSDPLGTLNPTNVPFVVLTTPTVIGGITYPAGVWIKTAFVADATITSAKIQSLVADKITTGSLTAAVGITTGLISGGVNTSFAPGSANFGTGFFLGNYTSTYQFYVGSFANNMLWNGTQLSIKGTVAATNATFQGLTVTDSSGNVLLGSGQISGAYVTGLSSGQISGLGTLATQNTVSTSQVTGLGALATQSNVFVGSTVRFADGTVMNTGDFVNRLSQINSTNISTFIASAAIGTAYIGNAAISTAKIQDAAITSAKIGNLAVSTLSIQGNAVTVPSTAFIATPSSLTQIPLGVDVTDNGPFYDTEGALIGSISVTSNGVVTQNNLIIVVGRTGILYMNNVLAASRRFAVFDRFGFKLADTGWASFVGDFFNIAFYDSQSSVIDQTYDIRVKARGYDNPSVYSAASAQVTVFTAKR